ncbi:hypothetical protein T07_13713 [Trichinella nelsoni]|uniref:Uncharacterized protein n=1 Tax=Trichinella nelsoni TaxID=6336 RepID=A0A0V0RC10_9BILA|nr:hypothetical protein T07_13713 [Trichinella nelsoni]
MCFLNPEQQICLCGDMNCIPDAALHELIDKGTVSSQRTDWRIKGALQTCCGFLQYKFNINIKICEA